jgi:hypothetical protein
MKRLNRKSTKRMKRNRTKRTKRSKRSKRTKRMNRTRRINQSNQGGAATTLPERCKSLISFATLDTYDIYDMLDTGSGAAQLISRHTHSSDRDFLTKPDLRKLFDPMDVSTFDRVWRLADTGTNPEDEMVNAASLDNLITLLNNTRVDVDISPTPAPGDKLNLDTAEAQKKVLDA